MVSPSRSVTIAFFQFGRVPGLACPTRRDLPRAFIVYTAVTFTPNSRSIAWRIAGLVASVATSNTYSPRAWYAAEVRSVTIGRTMVRCSVDMAYFPFLFFLGAADFFAAEDFFFFFFFGAAFAAAFFFGAVLALGAAFAFFAGFSPPSALAFFTRFAGVPSFSATGASVWPIAVASIRTTSDQSR